MSCQTRPLLTALLTAFLTVLPAAAQAPRIRDLRPICDTLTARLLRRTTVDYRVSVSKVEVKGDKLDITFKSL